MSFGQKKEKSSASKVTINAPPAITNYEYHSPYGDLFRTRVDGSTQISDSVLSPGSQYLANVSQLGMMNLADSFAQPDSSRVEQIRQRGEDFYRLNADQINRDSNVAFGKARSTLSQRFGGSFNSTFGNDFLARLEKNRLDELSDAQRRANLLSEDLFNSDEASRLNRFGTLMNVMNSFNNAAANASNQGSGLLQDESQRATSLAISQAQLQQNANNSDRNYNLALMQMEADQRQRRSQAAAQAIAAYYG